MYHSSCSLYSKVQGHRQRRDATDSENRLLFLGQIDGGAELTFTGLHSALLPGILASGVALVLGSVCTSNLVWFREVVTFLCAWLGKHQMAPQVSSSSLHSPRAQSPSFPSVSAIILVQER